jgi:hypothetical protein
MCVRARCATLELDEARVYMVCVRVRVRACARPSAVPPASHVGHVGCGCVCSGACARRHVRFARQVRGVRKALFGAQRCAANHDGLPIFVSDDCHLLTVCCALARRDRTERRLPVSPQIALVQRWGAYGPRHELAPLSSAFFKTLSGLYCPPNSAAQSADVAHMWLRSSPASYAPKTHPEPCVTRCLTRPSSFTPLPKQAADRGIERGATMYSHPPLPLGPFLRPSSPTACVTHAYPC